MRCMEEGCDEEGIVAITSLEKGGDGWEEVTMYYCEKHAKENKNLQQIRATYP